MTDNIGILLITLIILGVPATTAKCLYLDFKKKKKKKLRKK